jgi:hypothetical protein
MNRLEWLKGVALWTLAQKHVTYNRHVKKDGSIACWDACNFPDLAEGP